MLTALVLLALQVDAGPVRPMRIADLVDVDGGPGRPLADVQLGLRAIHAWHACARDREPTVIQASLTIRGDGTVAAASVSSQPPELAQCVTRALSSARFLSSSAPEQRLQLRVHLVEGTPPLAVSGSTDKDTIRRIVQSHAAAIRACYDAVLASAPRASGRVKVEWVINGGGVVTQVTIEESPPNFITVTDCLRIEIAKWTFPKTKGGGLVIVSFPFVFKRSRNAP